VKWLLIDKLIITLIVGLVALAIAIGCLIGVAWANSGSRNIALAIAALAASAVLLFVQIIFELQSKTDTDAISAEFTVDREKPEIRADYSHGQPSWRVGQDIGASNAMAQSNPNAFKGDLSKLTDDMTLRSLVSYLFAEQFDWQLKHVSVKGPLSGTWTTSEPLSAAKDCTTITSDQSFQELTTAGNAFNAGGFLHQNICLPPGSLLEIRGNVLSIRNPFARISFAVERTGGVMYGKPGSGGLDNPSTPDGTMQYETRVNNIRVSTEYTWIRAQHRDIDRYKAWAERVVSGARLWFEGKNSAP
jgi:hypothetical protein